MKNKKDNVNNKEYITLQCDCRCCMLVIDKHVIGDETNYNISIQDSYYNNRFSIWNRIKSACRMLMGKSIHYNDAFIDDIKMREFCDELIEFISG